VLERSPARAFGSWLELIAALDAARSSTPSRLAEKSVGMGKTHC
jgi:hypothetical protein